MVVKIKINEVKEENVQLRTRYTMMQNQLKEKDKLIDDLYKSAYITASGTQAKNNLNKDILMLVKLKKKVYELRDHLALREAEIIDLKKTLKSTKLKELEIEVK